MKLAAIDLIIIAAYMAVIVFITIRSRRFASQSLDNYFLAGRNMPGWMTGVSYAASMMSADSAVGYGGLAAVTGIYVCWFYLSRFGIALFLGAVLFAVYWRRLSTFTTLEFYEMRFEGLPGTLMRFWLAVRTSLVAMVAWTGISLLALVKISEPVLGWGKTETLALALPLSLAYVLISGYLGVVLSNLVQILVMLTGALVLAWRVLAAAGGPDQLAHNLSGLSGSALALFPPLDDPIFPLVACVAWLVGTSVGYGGDAAPMGGAVEGQRILSSRSAKEAGRMYVVTEVVLFTLVWLVSVPCLAAAVFWPELRNGGADRELAYGLLMTRYLTPGLLGLVYVAMLGGIISVVGDNLNFGSQVLLNDIYRRYLVRDASERHYLIAGRAGVLVILALALLVVYKVAFVFDVAVFMVGLSAAELSANWAQWWWWRFNGWGRVAASFGGGLFYIALALLWPGMAWWNRMFLSMAVSTALWIVATVITAPERQDKLIEFYRRAQPLGFWRPIQHLAGDLPPAAHGITPILIGLIIALCGAAAVMAWILGISELYVGGYAAGAGLLALMVGLCIAFRQTFRTFIDRLLTPAERAEGKRAEAGVADVDPFGLSAVFSVVCFATTAVAALQWIFFGGAISSVLVSIIAAAAGVIVLYRRRSALRKLSEAD
jgi:solute:Na+ symporter, SSS family